MPFLGSIVGKDAGHNCQEYKSSYINYVGDDDIVNVHKGLCERGETASYLVEYYTESRNDKGHNENYHQNNKSK